MSDTQTNAEIDISAPGLMIRSAGIHELYATASGTSVATPHVAGVAALYAEACPNKRGKDLWDLVIAKAKKIPGGNSSDVGAGIVTAPMNADTCHCDPIPPCL